MPRGIYRRTEEHHSLSRKNLTDYFASGSSVWNKGITKETDARLARIARNLSITNTGKHHSTETRQKMAVSHKGRKYNVDSIRRSESHKDQVPWNKGLTKETDVRVLRNADNIRIAWQTMLPEEKMVRRISYQSAWKNPIIKNEWIRKIRRSANLKPNKCELVLDLLLQNRFPGEWEYTGNGKLIINCMIPDFANINGKKQLIELFGNYWHRNENPRVRVERYLTMGYTCLVIWESELKLNPALVVKSIANFSKEV